MPGGELLRSQSMLGDGWELTLHKGQGFDTKLGADAIILSTMLEEDNQLFEHMNIDVQPSGDKDHTSLYLEVKFDTLLASALIEVPSAEEDGGE